MAIVAVAFYKFLEGEVNKAIELYALTTSHDYVGKSHWFDDLFGKQITEIAANLPEGQVEKAKSKGRSLDLWETAEYLLEELNERGLDQTADS